MFTDSIWLLVAFGFCVAILIYVLRMRNPKVATVIVAPVFLYLVAAVLGSAQLYFMGTMVLSIAVMGWIFSAVSLRGLAVTRTAATPVTCGEEVEIRIDVENRHRLPKLFLRVRCPLPDALRAENDTVAIAGLWPGQRTTAVVQAHALRRGCYALPPLEVVGADPLDLFPRTARFPTPQEVTVHPVPDTAPGLELLGDDLLGTVTPRRVLRPGHGLDFHGLREYHPDDDMRTIDWKATARLSRLIAVEFEPTQVGDLVVLLDNRAAAQAGTGDCSTLERGVALAAGAALGVLEGRGSVHLRALKDGTAVSVTARSGETIPLLDALARVQLADGPLNALVNEDLRGRTVLLITPGIGPEVALAARQAIACGGRVVALLMDPASFAGGGAAPDVEPAPRGVQATVGALVSSARARWQRARDEGTVDGIAAALHEAGARTLVVGPEGLSRERALRMHEEDGP